MDPAPRGLFGRDREISETNLALAAAIAGTPQVLLVGGDAGIGKTSLVSAMAEHGLDLGCTVLLGHCLDIDAGVPLGPVREAVRTHLLAQPTESLPPVTRRLAGFLAANEPVPVESSMGLIDDLCLVVGEIAQGPPLVLVLEDMHWADRSTQDFAVTLARTMSGPICLVLTFRSDDLTRRHPFRRALVEIGRSVGAHRLQLGPLDRSGISGLVQHATGASDPSLVGSILARSEGNPLYAEELLDSDRDSVPGELSDLLLARVEALSPPTRDLLRIASVNGSRIDPDLLAEVARQDESEVEAALREALDANVVTHNGEHLDFRHGLLREVIYDDLLPGERSRRHADLASVLQARLDRSAGSADPLSMAVLGVLAFHWSAAHNLPLTLAASVRAGVAARSYGAREAIVHLERALDLWDRVPEPEALGGLARPDILRLLGEAAEAHGDHERADRFVLAALDQIHDDADRLLASRVYATYGWLCSEFTDRLTQREALLLAIEYAEGEPSEELAKALRIMAEWHWRRESAGPAIALANRATEVAVSAGCPSEESWALLVLGAARFDMGDCREGIAMTRRSTEVAERAGLLGQAIGQQGQLACDLILLGEIDIGLELASAGRARGLAAGLPDAAAFNGEQEVDALRMTGRLDDADLLLEELREIGLHHHRWRVLRAEQLLARGDALSALPLEREAMAGYYAPGIPEPWHALRQIELFIALDELPEALRLAEHLLTETAVADSPLLLALAARGGFVALAAARAGAVAPSTRLFALSADALERSLDALTDSWRTTLHAAEALRAAAIARSLTEEPAVDEWRAAAAAAARFGAYAALPARLGLCEALLDAGERDEARALLVEAWRSAHDMGARGLEKQAVVLARRNRIPLPQERLPAELSRLTQREREVLGVLATGATNRAIAERLFISEKTVSVHVTNLLAKLGAANRGEAAALARDLAND